jgi:hypothetical protein
LKLASPFPADLEGGREGGRDYPQGMEREKSKQRTVDRTGLYDLDISIVDGLQNKNPDELSMMSPASFPKLMVFCIRRPFNLIASIHVFDISSS